MIELSGDISMLNSMVWYITVDIFTLFLWRERFLWAVIQKNMSLLDGIILFQPISTDIVFSPSDTISGIWKLYKRFFFTPLVSAQTLKSNLDSMNQQIQRLEKDIENFPKSQDEHDKFVEKMSISFLHILTGDLSILILCLGVYSTWKKSF